MQIQEMTEQECRDFLAGASFGRLGCALDDQPYVIPIFFVYDAGCAYALSTLGQKVKWMRKNPKVCIQVDDIKSGSRWASVIGHGTYQELPEPQFTEERMHARKLLERRPQWWLGALGERQLKSEDHLIEPLFFRIHIATVTGLRASDETQ